MTDQFNADCIGALGRRKVRTPNLDRLVRDGVCFQRAYANNPICAPSRITFISGQYCHTHGVLSNDTYTLENRNPDTVSAVFRRNGYQTALIGKSHMIGAWDREGFEYLRYCDLCDSELDDPCSVHYFQHLVDHGLADEYDHGSPMPGSPGTSFKTWTSSIPLKHCLEVWTGDETLKFIENRDPARPFFMQMSFQRPHEPLNLPYDMEPLYQPEDIDLPNSKSDWFENRFCDRHPFMRDWFKEADSAGYPYRAKDERDLKEVLVGYYSLITMIDEQIGRVIDYLKKTGEYDNTLIVFTADHGDFAGDHGTVFKNMGIFESIQRIPFIIRYPEGPCGTAVEEMIESVDLAPTLLDYCSLPVPEQMEGSSILPVIEGHASGKDEIICEWVMPLRYDEKVFALRTKRYRLVYLGTEQGSELYDHNVDPQEMHNVFDDPAYKDICTHLLERMVSHIGRFNYTANPIEERRLQEELLKHVTPRIHRLGVKWSKQEVLV